ncbi:MAG: hypothetical protein ACLPTZ_22765, partial [Beijerinckiaceae bacterium]
RPSMVSPYQGFLAAWQVTDVAFLTITQGENSVQIVDWIGSGGGTRTPDTRIMISRCAYSRDILKARSRYIFNELG